MSTAPDAFVPDLDAYFARIGYTGPRTPSLAVLHAITFAHASSIPFENVDVFLGRGISLDPATVERKLIHGGRGGYCFEQNGHLLRVLRALGFEAMPLSARVRWQRPRDFTPPRTHLFLRVELEGRPWLTDVGIGGMSLTSAIPFDDTAPELPTRHDTRRLLREDGRWFHQVRIAGAWQDVYEFTGEAMPDVDREVANWFTSAHPASHFRGRLIAARATPEGRLSLQNREFTRRMGEQAETVTLGTAADVLRVLREEFGLRLPEDLRFEV